MEVYENSTPVSTATGSENPAAAPSPTENIGRLAYTGNPLLQALWPRQDVYAEPWQRKDGTKGWSPVCANKWNPTLCALSRENNLTGKCGKCPHRSYAPLTENVLAAHHAGASPPVGIYLLHAVAYTRDGQRIENACYAAASDYDNHDPLKPRDPFADARALHQTAAAYGISLLLETSKSVKGVHAWTVFTDPVPASAARQLHLGIAAAAGVLPRDSDLSSFDRVFPSQDKGSGLGLGNLISGPLSGRYWPSGGSCFYDPLQNIYYADQWAFIAAIADQVRAGGGDLVMTPTQVHAAVERLAPFLPATPAPKAKKAPKPARTPGASKAVVNTSCASCIDKCAFLQHCRDHADALSEEDWKNMVSNISRLGDGAAVIHELSKPYPTYTAAETDAKIEHLRESSGPITCEYIQRTFSGCPPGGCGVKSPAALGSSKSPGAVRLRKSPAARGAGDSAEDHLFLVEADRFRVDFAVVAEMFLAERGTRMARGRLLHHRGAFYRYDGKKWSAMADADLRAAIVEFCLADDELCNRISPSFLKSVEALIAATGHVDSAKDLPAWIGEGSIAPRNLIVLDNGILDVQKALAGDPDALRPHSPELFSAIALPYSYDPTASCPRWIQILEEVLPEPDARRLLAQWFGYNLTCDTSRHAFLLMVGRGANGKSVVCLTLIALLGQANVSTVTLERLGGRFDLYETYGKLANVAPEMDDLDKPVEAMLKAFVGGDPVTYERKYKDTFSARPTARLTFATNNLPRFTDRSEGIWRRMLLLPFEVTIPPERQDRGLVDALQAELPGILNWALAGLRDLNEQGHFTEAAGSAKAKETYRRDVNSARSFLHEEVMEQPGAEIDTQLLYQTYSKWCEERGYRAFGENLFGKELKTVFPAVSRELRRTAANPRRHRVYVGVALIEPNLPASW